MTKEIIIEVKTISDIKEVADAPDEGIDTPVEYVRKTTESYLLNTTIDNDTPAEMTDLTSKLRFAYIKALTGLAADLKISIRGNENPVESQTVTDWQLLERNVDTGDICMMSCTGSTYNGGFVLNRNSIGEVAEMLIGTANGENT